MINRLPVNFTGAEGRTPVVLPAQANVSVAVKQDNTIFIPGNYDKFPIPPALTQTIVSNTGAGALAKSVYFGNEDAFNVTPTDNGSGANSIVPTYGDGFTGKSYNRSFAQPSVASSGLQCYGFTLQFITTNGGAQNSAGLTLSNPTLLTSNGTGSNMIPQGIVLSQGARNTQYLSGVMTVSTKFVMNSVTQLTYIVPVGNTSTLTVMTSPF